MAVILTAAAAFQASIFELLKGDPELAVLAPGGFFDGAVPSPINLLWPYAVIDSWTEDENDRLSTVGRRVTFMVQVFSKDDGFLKANLLNGNIIDRLNHKRFTANGWNCTLLRYIQSVSFVQSDYIRRVSSRFQILCQPLPS